MSWTDERVDLLTKMWGEGQSASEIAKALGGITRNAVIGKVHRLGLPGRNSGQPEAAPAAEPAAGPSGEPAAEMPDTEPAQAEPEAESDADPETEETAAPTRASIVPAGQPLPPQPSANEISAEALETVREAEEKAPRLSLMELTERTCKWPKGDPATSDFWFCGLPVQPGKPYCEAHVGLAFQPVSSRRDRRR